MTVWEPACTAPDPKTVADKQYSAIIYFIIYICLLPTVTGQIVLYENGLFCCSSISLLFFHNWVIVKSFFKYTVQNIYTNIYKKTQHRSNLPPWYTHQYTVRQRKGVDGWLQLLKCEKLAFFLVLCDSKLNINGFWTVGQTKHAICTVEITLGVQDGHFSLFSDIIGQTIVD